MKPTGMPATCIISLVKLKIIQLFLKNLKKIEKRAPNILILRRFF